MHFDSVGSEPIPPAEINSSATDKVFARGARRSTRFDGPQSTRAYSARRVARHVTSEDADRRGRSRTSRRDRARRTARALSHASYAALRRRVAWGRPAADGARDSGGRDRSADRRSRRGRRARTSIRSLESSSRSRRTPGCIYRIIAGMRRLRAAQRAELATVPCLVHELDERRFADMRAAAAHRLTIPAPTTGRERSRGGTAEPIQLPSRPPGAAIGEAALGLEFVSALLPAMNAAGNDKLALGCADRSCGGRVVAHQEGGRRAQTFSTAGPIRPRLGRLSVLVSSVVLATRNGSAASRRPSGGVTSWKRTDRDIFLDGAPVAMR